MKILSHRGYWQSPHEKNGETAFRRSFSNGFGTETDIRDYAGELVISHDVPRGNEIPFRRFLEIHAETGPALPLALNVKADGLQQLVASALQEFRVSDYFLFDMSVPDAVGYVKAGLRLFSRHSDVEQTPVLYQDAQGVWLDAFHTDWLTEETLAAHLAADKRVCIVSPELHGREYRSLWKRLAAMPLRRENALMLCTDLPQAALELLG